MNPNAARETLESYLARGGKITKITPADTLAIARERQASDVASLRDSLNKLSALDFDPEAGGADAGEVEESTPAPEAPTFREVLHNARRAGKRLFACGACGEEVPFRTLRYDVGRMASVCKACRAKEEAEAEARDLAAVAA